MEIVIPTKGKIIQWSRAQMALLEVIKNCEEQIFINEKGEWLLVSGMSVLDFLILECYTGNELAFKSDNADALGEIVKTMAVHIVRDCAKEGHRGMMRTPNMCMFCGHKTEEMS